MLQQLPSGSLFILRVRELFVDTVVPRIDITVNPDTLAWIYANPSSDREFHAAFVFDNGRVRDTVDPVGFRLRGNTSRNSQKKPFKVSFNTFTPGGKYYGVEKMNLNGEHNDPTVMRSKVMWDILRKWNIAVPGANHVRVYINGNYYGLYINVEHIDEEFAGREIAVIDVRGFRPGLYIIITADGRSVKFIVSQ
ncbi:MAG: CotH kinase family protein [Bacteroidales bacterium]